MTPPNPLPPPTIWSFPSPIAGCWLLVVELVLLVRKLITLAVSWLTTPSPRSLSQSGGLNKNSQLFKTNQKRRRMGLIKDRHVIILERKHKLNVLKVQAVSQCGTLHNQKIEEKCSNQTSIIKYFFFNGLPENKAEVLWQFMKSKAISTRLMLRPFLVLLSLVEFIIFPKFRNNFDKNIALSLFFYSDSSSLA